MTIAVIGSGPAGAATAHALCDLGLRVTMLDAGDRIEPGRMQPFDVLGASEPELWSAELARRARGAFAPGVKHVPLKPAYGSLFPYALDDPDLPLVCEDADASSSLAYGGLSNAWGASILPCRQQDIADWPISLAELEPHYRAVQQFVPIAGDRDELSAILPLYADPAPLPRSRQAQALLAHMRRHAPALNAAGLAFGASRLAVIAAPDDRRHCRHCGLCLHGCPYGSIYNAAHTVEALRHDGRLEYRGGVHVDRVSEAGGDRVAIDFHERRRPSTRGRLTFSRAFVACGAISSTRLMLSSTGRARGAVRMCDSQYFAVPMLAGRSSSVSVATQGNTLAQLFIELEADHVSRHTVHMQVYGYNDIMLAALTRRLPLPATALERTLRPLLGRLLVVQGFLHSADSPGLTLDHDAGGLRVIGDDVGAATVRVRQLVRRLARLARPLGMAPLPGLVTVGRPGKSNHLGGSLRMRRGPRELETDPLGRLPTWERVHVVDASVLPSVPATTVTLSVMANAHRIATAACADDAR